MNYNYYIADPKFDELYDLLTEYEIATRDEISLVTRICGNNIETLESILFARTGYRSLEQFKEYELEEE